MEILLWLVPAACASVVAMAWVAWWGRETRTSIDRDEAARRLGEALARSEGAPRYAAPRRPDGSAGGVAVRRSHAPPRPASEEVAEVRVRARAEVEAAPAVEDEVAAPPAVEEHRHAS